MDCTMPSTSALVYLPEFAQIHVHWDHDLTISSSAIPFSFYVQSFPSMRIFSSESALVTHGLQHARLPCPWLNILLPFHSAIVFPGAYSKIQSTFTQTPWVTHGNVYVSMLLSVRPTLSPLPWPQVPFLCLHLYSCPANRFISTSFSIFHIYVLIYSSVYMSIHLFLTPANYRFVLLSLWVWFYFVNKFVCVIFKDFAYVISYNICLSLSDLIHLVWWSPDPSMLLQMALFLFND